jgi:hypothetical protein
MDDTKEGRRSMKAYVLVQTQWQAEPIAERLGTVPGILSAEDLEGPFDAIAVATTDAGDRALTETLDRVRSLPSVIRALPAPVSQAEIEDEAA